MTKRLSDGRALGAWLNNRSEEAFTELVRRHGPMVRGTCARLLRPSEVDDAVQAVFMVLARKAGRLRRREQLGGWLHRCAVLVARHAVRARNRRTRAELAAMSLRPGWTVERDHPWRAVAPRLDAALNALPKRYREAIVLCYLEGVTQREAARRLGKPAGTIASLCARGLQRLRVRLRAASQESASLAGLAGVLRDHAGCEATPGWAEAITGSVSGGAGTGVPAMLAGGAMKAMALTEVRNVGLPAAGLILCGVLVAGVTAKEPGTGVVRTVGASPVQETDSGTGLPRAADPEAPLPHAARPAAGPAPPELPQRTSVTDREHTGRGSPGGPPHPAPRPGRPQEADCEPPQAPSPAPVGPGAGPEVVPDEGRVRLFRRHPPGDDVRATYSFEFATRDDVERVRNDWDVILRGGRTPADPFRFGVRMTTGDKSIIFDCGAVGLHRRGTSWPAPEAEGEDLTVVLDHVYLVHTEDSDSDLWSALKVVEISPGHSVVITWRRLHARVTLARAKPGERPTASEAPEHSDEGSPVEGSPPDPSTKESSGHQQVRLFARGPDDDYLHATYSFEYATRDDMERIHNDWDVVLQGGLTPKQPFMLMVNSITNDRSRIADLGVVRLKAIDRAFTTTEGHAALAFKDLPKAKTGHAYLVHTLDDDSDFWAAFRIDEIVPGHSVLMSWKLLTEPQRRWDRPSPGVPGVRRPGHRRPKVKEGGGGGRRKDPVLRRPTPEKRSGPRGAVRPVPERGPDPAVQGEREPAEGRRARLL